MPEITNEEAINGMHKAEDAARGGYSSCDSKNSVRFAVGSIRWDQFQRVLHLAECWVKFREWHYDRLAGNTIDWRENERFMNDLESPPPKDPLDELEEAINSKAIGTLTNCTTEWLHKRDLLAKIKELKGRSK